jgi:hypothetical protein
MAMEQRGEYIHIPVHPQQNHEWMGWNHHHHLLYIQQKYVVNRVDKPPNGVVRSLVDLLILTPLILPSLVHSRHHAIFKFWIKNENFFITERINYNF